MEEKSSQRTNMDWVQYFFTDEYHDLKLTHNMSAGQTGYHTANSVVPTGDTTSTLDKLEMDATTDQNHVDQMMKKICQLTKTNKILGDRIKKLAKKTRSCLGKAKKIKSQQTKMKVT